MAAEEHWDISVSAKQTELREIQWVCLFNRKCSKYPEHKHFIYVGKKPVYDLLPHKMLLIGKKFTLFVFHSLLPPCFLCWFCLFEQFVSAHIAFFDVPCKYKRCLSIRCLQCAISFMLFIVSID